MKTDTKYEIIGLPASLMMVFMVGFLVMGFILGPIAWRNGYKQAQLDAMNAEISILDKEIEQDKKKIEQYIKEIESNEQKLKSGDSYDEDRTL